MKLINMSLADLIITYPDAIALLQSYQIDLPEFKHTHLMALLNKKDFPRTKFLVELQQIIITSVCAHYKSADVAILVNEIVKRFHEPHRAQLSALINGARYVEKKNAEHAGCPQGLSALLIDFLDDLASHMDQEELFLFPALVAAGNFNMFPQIAVAHHSHDRHINMMAKLNSITHNFTPPSDASIQWQELYENLLEFILQLNIHIAIENQLLLDD